MNAGQLLEGRGRWQGMALRVLSVSGVGVLLRYERRSNASEEFMRKAMAYYREHGRHDSADDVERMRYVVREEFRPMAWIEKWIRAGDLVEVLDSRH